MPLRSVSYSPISPRAPCFLVASSVKRPKGCIIHGQTGGLQHEWRRKELYRAGRLSRRGCVFRRLFPRCSLHSSALLGYRLAVMSIILMR